MDDGFFGILGLGRPALAALAGRLIKGRVYHHPIAVIGSLLAVVTGFPLGAMPWFRRRPGGYFPRPELIELRTQFGGLQPKGFAPLPGR